MTYAHILVVAEQSRTVEEIQRMLQQTGAAAAGVASSGENALAQAETTPPEVVLIDSALPGKLSAGEVGERMRTRFDLPVVYLTTAEEALNLPQAPPAPWRYLLKPFTARELQMAVEIARGQHQHEQRVQELTQQLHEASRLKNNFLASMSHELRTPLNAMIGYTSLTLNALKDQLPPEHLQNLTRAEQSARILLQLINDVLDFSKIEAGRLQTFIEEIELRDLLEDLMLTAEGLLSEKPVALRADFPQDLPLIESDYTRVKQILSNLIDNAIKFTAAGAVTLRAIPLPPPAPPQAGGSEGVRVEVEDTGCGIPAELLGSIFDIRQADGSLTKKFKGTGLGLALTKKLSEMLGIKIGVRSEVNQGTTFWLDLPVKFQSPVAHTPAPPALDLTRAAAEPTAPAPKFVAPPGKAEPDLKALVLCFCDQEMCSNLRRHLAGLPLEVRPVQTAAECVAIGAQAPVWAMVLESDEGGFKMLTQLKSEPSFQHIPIIMSSPEMAQYGFHVGSLEYLEKPIDNQKLLDALLRITRVPKGDILVVDDDTMLRHLYGQVLSQAGYTTYTADNGVAALHTLRDHTAFQAIILDLMMPEMDGFQVLAQIQRDQTWQRIPVVVVTGKTLSAAEKKMLRNGTQLLLEKEKFPMAELSQKIEAIVQAVTLAGTRTILVVDDNEMNLNLMTSVFASAGYAVLKAASAQEGIARAKEVLPSTILMDLAMPGMDGFEATRLLKAQPETAHITVIACSAFTAPEYKEKAAQVGCEGYITKPIEPNRLIEQVTRFMLTSKIKQKFAHEAPKIRGDYS